MTNPFENIMQQAQKMQTNMKEAQEALAKLKITGEAGAGLVKVIVNGNGDALEISIDESLYQEERQVLQGLIVAAINDANRKKERTKQEKMKEIFGQLGLPPGMNFPFMTE